MENRKILNNPHQRCIDACLRCFQACKECAALCMREPDAAARATHIAMMQECASICKAAACLIIMNGKHAKEMCRLCVTVCEKCASGCAVFKDDHCQECSEECRKCAVECNAMASHID